MTKMQLYNAALVMVSTATVASDPEDSPPWRACNALFPARYEALLGIAAWPFALKRFEIQGRLSAAEIPEFRYEFDLPEDFIKMLGWGGVTEPRPKVIEGQRIYSNQTSPAILIYIARVEFELARGPFLECMELKLAAELASKFRHDDPLSRRILVQFERTKQEAISSITEFVDLPGPSVDTTPLISMP